MGLGGVGGPRSRVLRRLALSLFQRSPWPFESERFPRHSGEQWVCLKIATLKMGGLPLASLPSKRLDCYWATDL